MSELRYRFENKLFKEAIKETSPFLRSMISRREAKEAAYNTAMPVYPIFEELVEALERLNAGYSGMFGHPGKTHTQEAYEIGSQIVQDTLDKLNAWLDGSNNNGR